MSGFLDGPAPRWFTIAAHRPFLEDLAGGIWRALSPLGPDAVSQAVVLVPNRRTARALASAFLDAAGSRAVLPPQIRAIGDLDEDEPPFETAGAALDLPPAIGPARRRFELAGLVAANGHLLDRHIDARAALDLADALARFLDACQIEELDETPDLAALAPGELARHWQASVDFLAIALEAWPRRLSELGLMDAAARRVALLRALTARWTDRPPAEVLVAAGSTGSTKATADLLAAVAAAPKGCVVLPGLDLSLAEGAWRDVDDQHPQGALRRLLKGAGVAREDVIPWEGSRESPGPGRWRRRLINEALRPPDATADWLEVIEAIEAEGEETISQGLAGLSLISARDEEEAAATAALLLREALETPDRTAVLVSPDAALARRVIARLSRWNITPDSSVGLALAGAPAPVLAHLTARAYAFDPVTLLAIVKHPLTRLGLDPDRLVAAREALERHGLRGPAPDGWEGLVVRLAAAMPDEDGPRRRDLAAALDFAGRLRAALSVADNGFATGWADPPAAARALAESLEALAEGPGALWSGQAGEGLARLIASLIEEGGSLPQVNRAGFAELLDGLMAAELVRPGGASHPRLRILGVLEARLVRADLTILAGLVEGVWPAPAPVDPFLSRPMREMLGLPSPERRIGLSAHDFAQAACAPEVVLIGQERRGGAPAVASRWLWRLRTLIAGARLEPPGRPEVLEWARALDAPLADPIPPALAPAKRPRPTPPIAARPRELPVTAIERWVRDPYAIYAQRILRLRPLDPPGAPIEALARGTAIHRAFERFATDYPEALPEGAEALFETLILEELLAAGMPRARMARERALACNVAPWVLGFERRRRPGARLLIEQKGLFAFEAPGGPFTLTARADRIEVRDESADVIDFKTGAPPSMKMVRAGLAPQLTLTAALLAAGGFADLGPLTPGELLYVKVSGGRIPGREDFRDEGDAPALAAAALAGLRRRVAWFDNEATPYVSRAAPQFIDSLGDYDHLARLWEWHVIGEAENGE
ncbi:MAG TPA: double-strand break repair protein AddB [Caulobacteraceae bacterium]